MTEDIVRLGRAVRALFDGFGGGRGGGRDGGIPSQFPPGGIDFIKHDLRVMMSSEKGDYQEIIEMTGGMVIQRADPHRGEKGRRQIDFKVLSWAATGWSEKFGAAITYVLSEGIEQPVSRIVAEQDEFDFPATFSFEVIFDARINNERLFSKLHGRPEGHGFRQVPPSGDRALSPTITRFEDLGLVTFRHPDLGDIVVKPVDCNDRQGETLRELPGMRLIGPPGLLGGGGGGGGRSRGGGEGRGGGKGQGRKRP